MKISLFQKREKRRSADPQGKHDNQICRYQRQILCAWMKKSCKIWQAAHTVYMHPWLIWCCQIKSFQKLRVTEGNIYLQCIFLCFFLQQRWWTKFWTWFQWFPLIQQNNVWDPTTNPFNIFRIHFVFVCVRTCIFTLHETHNIVPPLLLPGFQNDKEEHH